MSKYLAIGCGGAGNALLNTLASETNMFDDPKEQNLYYNTTHADLLPSYIGKKLVLNADGTGRDKRVGLELVKKNIEGILDNIDSFYTKNTKNTKAPNDFVHILVITSLGGGTGSSVTPAIVDYLQEIKSDKTKISIIGVMSSSKEGVATLPNCIKTFDEFYNAFCLTQKTDNFIVFDNEKFEKDYGFSTYDYSGINTVIAETIERIFDETVNEKSNSAGMQALDLNEKRRVMYWGQGLSDYITCEMDEESMKNGISLDSSIFNGKYKLSTAKAVSLKINFAYPSNKIAEDTMEDINVMIAEIKKTFKNSFFVFGYEFNSTKTDYISFDIYINGLEFPKTLQTFIKKATKDVSKLKEKNTAFELNGDLEF